jgi:hypothetical protein
MKVAWDDPTINQDHDLARVVGEFFRDCGPWDWWIGLTFQGPVTQGRAHDVFQSWARKLAQDVVRDHVELAWVLDGNGGHWHYHTLLGLPDAVSVTAAELDRLWKATEPGLTGHAHIRAYDSGRGAAFYMGKKTNRYSYSVSTVCARRPCCRRPGKGCVKSQHAW